MEKIKLTILISRALQILFALIVLGTSISMLKFANKLEEGCKGCALRLPASTSFSAFVGGFSALASTVNLATEIIHFLPFIATLGLDGLVLLFFTASGVNLIAVRTQWNSKWGKCDEGTMCRNWTTNNSFCFLGMLVTGVVIVVLILRKRKEKSAGGGRDGGGVAML